MLAVVQDNEQLLVPQRLDHHVEQRPCGLLVDADCGGNGSWHLTFTGDRRQVDEKTPS
ncbi:MAG TPA: hypothetical protein VME46_07505 [Acidimicrobiales bacterium]|nr:hypothetical protein [Acidimicrobiales bacterium]